MEADRFGLTFDDRSHAARDAFRGIPGFYFRSVLRAVSGADEFQVLQQVEFAESVQSPDKPLHPTVRGGRRQVRLHARVTVILIAPLPRSTLAGNRCRLTAVRPSGFPRLDPKVFPACRGLSRRRGLCIARRVLPTIPPSRESPPGCRRGPGNGPVRPPPEIPGLPSGARARPDAGGKGHVLAKAPKFPPSARIWLRWGIPSRKSRSPCRRFRRFSQRGLR